MERELCTQAYTLAEGNQAKAARWLGQKRDWPVFRFIGRLSVFESEFESAGKTV